MSKKCKVISLYGGPGTGKSTTAAAVFAELKYRGINCEIVTEYAKDKAWEFGKAFMRGVSDQIEMPVPKVFQAQEYIFGQQHFRLRRAADEVDVIITDSPLLLGLVYMPENFDIPSMRGAIVEAYERYDNLDVMLTRVKKYNPNGRFQTFEEAKQKDIEVREVLKGLEIEAEEILAGREAVDEILLAMTKRGWDIELNVDLTPQTINPSHLYETLDCLMLPLNSDGLPLFAEEEARKLLPLLEHEAKEIGGVHSEVMQSMGRDATPNAYKATTSWMAHETIKTLLYLLSKK